MITAIARKEFRHILRDPRTLAILFLMPLIQLVMFGYALKMEIQEVHLAVLDYSKSPASRELIRQFEGSAFFQPFSYSGSPAGIDHLFKQRRARAALVIPASFEKNIRRRPETALQVLIDASDANAAAAIRNYLTQVISRYNSRHNARLKLPFELRGRILYNPDQKSTWFFVPGLIAMLLIMVSALLTSITITREKESGTLEQMLVSPVRAHQIILGKVLPYILLAFLLGITILLAGMLIFQVPFRGSALLLLLLSILYITTALSLGLMISTLARTQQVAMMMALMITLLPTIMLSGFIFPIASMPALLQYISWLVPARFYLLIVRGIMLKGSGLLQLLTPTLALAVMSLVLLMVSIRKFNINLEK
ncbi:MAG: ABC transporter permease [Calditrichia bacterium]